MLKHADCGGDVPVGSSSLKVWHCVSHLGGLVFSHSLVEPSDRDLPFRCLIHHIAHQLSPPHPRSGLWSIINSKTCEGPLWNRSTDVDAERDAHEGEHTCVGVVSGDRTYAKLLSFPFIMFMCEHLS